MNVENNHTAERQNNGSSVLISSIHTSLPDEDEDVHKCGRCQTEFSTLDSFIQHKLQQHGCGASRPANRAPPARSKVPAALGPGAPPPPLQGATKSEEDATVVSQEDHGTQASAASGDPASVKKEQSVLPDESKKAVNNDKLAEGVLGVLGRGCRKRAAAVRVAPPPPQEEEEEEAAASDEPAETPGDAKKDRPYEIKDGRYMCHLCKKTFKTTNILRTHMHTHSEQKKYSCELCGTSFRTKGSLIRHSRRHTDERPYRCTLCGLSFRESGALTRHLKSITPCTEKIRFNQYKEILVSRDGLQKGLDTAAAAAVVAPLTEHQEALVEHHQHQHHQVEVEVAQAEGHQLISVVEAGGQEVIHQVHFTMEVDGTLQEQQVMVEQSQAEALAAAAAAGDSVICQAIINSGIALKTQQEEGEGEAAQPTAPLVVEVVQEEESSQAAEEIRKVVFGGPDGEGRLTEIQVTEECVEMEAEEDTGSDGQEEQPASPKLHKCPHCNRSFKALNYLRFHVKGHLGYKPFKCSLCEKEFVTGYLLKKHMEIHVSERRYKCGECGKLYKTIGHVREHMRAHSDERPYHCAHCNKAYKTKNALQVHQRTHGQEKPYVCQFCSRGFREKGSLVRHIRHHTGEKPFKCPKCERGFAEHGTLNRHLRAKGGCHKDDGVEQPDEVEEEVTEEEASVDSLATATIISEDPHAVLVEFSSVVADTQEYIIGTTTQDAVEGGEVTLIQDTHNQLQMGDHIMKVVQQMVSQARGGAPHPQIIVRNMSLEEEGAGAASISDCGDTITIATPESLTEQVAMTLASAISDGTLLATASVGTPGEGEGGGGGGGPLVESMEGGVVTVVTATQEEEPVEEEEVQQQQEEEYVMTSTEEVEIQTVVV